MTDLNDTMANLLKRRRDGELTEAQFLQEVEKALEDAKTPSAEVTHLAHEVHKKET